MKIYHFIILFLFSNKLYGQSIFVGIKSGPIYPIYKFEFTDYKRVAVDIEKSNLNYMIGIDLEYKLTEKSSFSFESSYEKHLAEVNSYRYKATPDETVTNNKILYDYLAIPLLYSYHHAKSGLFIVGGISTLLRLNAYVMTSVSSGIILGNANVNYNSKSTFFNYGYIIGLGYEKKISEKIKFSLEFRDRQILNNQFVPSGIEQHLIITSNTLFLMLEFKVKL